MRILLLCSTFNGLSQRAWIELCAAGNDGGSDATVVAVQLKGSDPDGNAFAEETTLEQLKRTGSLRSSADTDF